MVLPAFSCRVVCSLIAERDGKVLLLHRIPASHVRKSAWDLPGGILEQGEDLVESVTRELGEESGLFVAETPRIVHVESKNENEFWVKLVFVAKVKPGNVKISFEHDDFRWVIPVEALKLDFGKGGEFQMDAIRKLMQSGK